MFLKRLPCRDLFFLHAILEHSNVHKLYKIQNNYCIHIKILMYFLNLKIFMYIKIFIKFLEQPITWEVEFFPRGIKYNKAKMVWGEDVPEVSLNTVRLRVTCKHLQVIEKRFKVRTFQL